MSLDLTDQIRRHLTDDLLVWLTTVAPSGRPAPRLVWFLWDGSDCVVYSQPDAAKLRHIAANPNVTLSFNSDPAGTDVVVLAGTARLAADAPRADAFPGLLTKYADLLDRIGMRAESFTDTYTTALLVRPERSWTIGR